MKALPLRNLADVEVIKHELNLGNILILKITPLANKNVEDVKKAVNELSVFTQSIGGDIASLGEERVVIVPQSIKIWRPETVVPKKAPTAA
ncbi:MAG: cell division protein SepF [Candidatus Bathyarchaeum sp.]|nr:MAG: cell division protein SepF [Candidatus Bathyarchaeum sp.]